jgi:hypothetical protein
LLRRNYGVSVYWEEFKLQLERVRLLRHGGDGCHFIWHEEAL